MLDMDPYVLFFSIFFNFLGVAYFSYGKNKIANLWLPFFCVSCNISNITQVILRKGLLWKAIRSSTAVPAIFPPVVINGHLHLDGGIINNLPVDIMRNLSRHWSYYCS